MDTSKIIRGVVSSGRYTVTAPIVKEDYGLYLQIEGVELPQTYEVDFSNSEHSGTSVTMIGNADGVLIPHQFISTGKDIFAFLYHVGANYGKTVYKFRIPNKVRPDRTDETPTPEEQSVIDQTISALNTAVAKTAQDVESADQSARSASGDADRAESARDTAGEYANDAQSSAESASESARVATEKATASAESASASAQIKADVEDLADDAQGYAESALIASQASVTARNTAHGYAQSASASAQSASTSASNASASANTASTKASEASTSAQTASQKATESAQSASQALTYKNDAESAKTASQTAQGLAESARDSAVSAKTDAESARDDAETARDEAQQAVASISGALDDKAPVITDTASGAIASFTDGADDLPLKSLVVNIDPVQDLHGYDSPWVAGGGKNKINVPDVTISSGSYLYNGALALPAGTYTLSFTSSSGASTSASLSITDADGTAMVKGSHVVPYTFTLPNASANAKIYVSGAGTYTNIQIEEGSIATAYAPYENICLISGWTQVGVEQRGKNLLPNQKAVGSGLQVNIGQEATGTSAYGVHLKAGTYTLLATTSVEARAYYRESDGTANTPIFGLGTDMHGTFTLSKESDVRIWLYNANGLTPADVLTFQLEPGSTATPYEPYTGRSITIDLGQTVYGGHLDVLSGVLTVDRALVDLGTLTWQKYPTASPTYVRALKPSDAKGYANNVIPNVLSSDTVPNTGSNIASGQNGVTIDASGNGYVRYLDATIDLDNIVMTGKQLVYELATPIEIQLSANQINSLYGVNNIWADSGDTEVEYRADTKAWIQRKIAEAIASLT